MNFSRGASICAHHFCRITFKTTTEAKSMLAKHLLPKHAHTHTHAHSLFSLIAFIRLWWNRTAEIAFVFFFGSHSLHLSLISSSASSLWSFSLARRNRLTEKITREHSPIAQTSLPSGRCCCRCRRTPFQFQFRFTINSKQLIFCGWVRAPQSTHTPNDSVNAKSRCIRKWAFDTSPHR